MKIMQRIQSRSEVVRSCRAIELGTTSVRSAVLRRKGKRILLLEAHEIPLRRDKSGPPTPEALGEALQQLIGVSKRRAEVVTSSLPMHKIFVRDLLLPFTKTAQIAQVIASEAELHIPFPLDQVIIDFWPIETVDGDKTRVMMVAVKKELLRDHLALLAEAGFDPAQVGVDFVNLVNGVRLSGSAAPEEVTVLVEIGAVHTGVAFLSRNRASFMRSFIWGGDAVSTSIMKELGCGFQEAERLKTASPPDEEVAARVKKAIFLSLQNLETELVRTLHSASAATGGQAPGRLILAGKTALHPPVKDFLQKKLGCPLAEVEPEQTLARSRRRPAAPVSWSCLGSALSLLKPSEKKLNFRRGEFTFQGSWEMIKRRLWVSGALFLILVGVWAAGLGMKITAAVRRYETGEDEIRSLLETTFPALGRVNPGDEVYEMEEALKRMETDYKYYQIFASASAFEILREISQIIPPDIKVQAVEVDIDQERVHFRGRTDSYRSAERIKNSFRKSGYFQADKIREGDTKTKMVGGKLVTVEFNYYIPFVTR